MAVFIAFSMSNAHRRTSRRERWAAAQSVLDQVACMIRRAFDVEAGLETDAFVAERSLLNPRS